MPDPVFTTVEALLDRYDVFFLDAYGVLVNSEGALPGAAAFLEQLERRRKPYWLLSNDAARGVHTSWQRYTGFGVPLRADRILTSGTLLQTYFQRNALEGARCLVLGTDDSRAYVEAAGGQVCSYDDRSATVCVLADDMGFPFLDAMNDVVSVLLERLEKGLFTHLILPNPDLVFPRLGGFGITAGAMAAAVEAVLSLRDPSGRQRFVPLGKPEPHLFEAAMQRLDGQVAKSRIVMLGDQLITDVLGAARFGIDSALLLTGISRTSEIANAPEPPTYVLPSLLSV